MATVRRGNVILDIKDNEVERYSDMGYDILGSSGEVIRKSIPSDPNVLKVAYRQHLDEIRKLNEEIQELKSQLSSSKKSSDVEAGSEAPVKTRRKRSSESEG